MRNAENMKTLLGFIPGYAAETNTYANAKCLVQAQVEMMVMGGATQRFHTVRTVSQNTVAEHSHGVAMICWLVLGQDTGVHMLMAALTHDLAEHKTGDIPAPAKRALGIRAEFGMVEEAVLEAAYMSFQLDDLEQLVLKYADAADGCLYCLREKMLGNKWIEPAWKNYAQYLHDCTERLEAWVAQPGREHYGRVSERAKLVREDIMDRWTISTY